MYVWYMGMWHHGAEVDLVMSYSLSVGDYVSKWEQVSHLVKKLGFLFKEHAKKKLSHVAKNFCRLAVRYYNQLIIKLSINKLILEF